MNLFVYVVMGKVT